MKNYPVSEVHKTVKQDLINAVTSIPNLYASIPSRIWHVIIQKEYITKYKQSEVS
jgi:hypothetical protein